MQHTHVAAIHQNTRYTLRLPTTIRHALFYSIFFEKCRYNAALLEFCAQYDIHSKSELLIRLSTRILRAC